jgi:regulator of CtrA degradation
VTPAPTFFNRTYDETMSLLLEARNYIAYQETVEQQTLDAEMRLRISYESMRITSRLTQVMAWLLAQKAVHAGEMTAREAASEEYALAGHDVCAEPSGHDDGRLPPGLRSLLVRSHALYMRISRLEEQFRRSVA